jgi:hypothetical protein
LLAAKVILDVLCGRGTKVRSFLSKVDNKTLRSLFAVDDESYLLLDKGCDDRHWVQQRQTNKANLTLDVPAACLLTRARDHLNKAFARDTRRAIIGFVLRSEVGIRFEE